MSTAQPPDNEHVERELASNDEMNIRGCSCGTIHIHTGPVSLHMDESSLRSLAQVVNDALESLDNPPSLSNARQLYLLPPTSDPDTPPTLH